MTRTLFAGVAAHAMIPLSAAASSGPGLLLLAPASVTGWPIAVGGSQSIADALASCLIAAGGEIVTGRPITRFDELPSAPQYYFDTSVHSLVDILGDRLAPQARRRYRRWRYGPGVCKIDFLLAEPIPWPMSAPTRTATVHVAQDYRQIADAESAVARVGRGCWPGSRRGSIRRARATPAAMSPGRTATCPTGRRRTWVRPWSTSWSAARPGFAMSSSPRG